MNDIDHNHQLHGEEWESSSHSPPQDCYLLINAVHSTTRGLPCLPLSVVTYLSIPSMAYTRTPIVPFKVVTYLLMWSMLYTRTPVFPTQGCCFLINVHGIHDDPHFPLKAVSYLSMSSMVYTSPTTPIPISTKIVTRVVASDFITDQTVGICTCAIRCEPRVHGQRVLAW